MSLFKNVFALGAMTILGACGSSNGTTPAPDASNLCREGINSGLGMQTCTTLAQQGVCYKTVTTKAFAPPTGGTFADGVYVLTGVKVIDTTRDEGTVTFTNPPVTIAFKNGTVERIIDPGRSADEVKAFTGQFFNHDPTTLAVNATCPVVQQGTLWPYTATGTTLVVQDNKDFESTYEKK